ncbi:NAD(P)-binding protein [Tuber magnatum]|uniref:NAD(P)-binding protein n=1 Tax=Tuber magnatum TaxID=42249 RepID=A0A317SPJ5_9PEZI|nr:NAD(P)-binding protein [Tuber magnatum]
MTPSPTSPYIASHIYTLYLLLSTTLHLFLQILLSLLSLPATLHTHLLHNGAKYLEEHYHTPNSFALITGATDGIGRAFALELAERGWNIILHGRTQARIKPLLEHLREKYPRQTFLPLPIDAADVQAGGVSQALQKLEPGIRLTLLINNAGALPPVRAFPDLSDEEVIDNVAVNVTFGALVVKALMNGWFSRRACVLGMGSVGAVMTLPGTPTYSASKSYTHKFYACLQTQLSSPHPAFSTATTTPASSPKQLEILPIIVGGVRTKMTPISEDGNIFFLTPQAFARHALAKVGLGREVYGYFWHEVQMWCITIWPEEGGMRGWVNGVMMRGVEKLRAEGWRRLSDGARMVDGKLVGGLNGR